MDLKITMYIALKTEWKMEIAWFVVTMRQTQFLWIAAMEVFASIVEYLCA